MPRPTNYDRILNQRTTSGKFIDRWFWKVGLVAETSGAPTLFWVATGFPGAGAVPATGSGTIPTNSTQGALIVGNADAGEASYITDLEFNQVGAAVTGLWLVDILWFNSGLSGTVATPQTINSSALTRYTGADSAGNMLGLVCWTATGATNVQVQATYTDQDGNGSALTPLVDLWQGYIGGTTATPTANQFQVLPLASGDFGIRSIESIDLSATTGTAGNWGACIFRLLAMVTCNSTNKHVAKDYVIQTPNLPQKLDNACLGLVVIPNSTGAGLFMGKVSIVEA